MKLAAQVASTSDTDYAYSVSQLEQKSPPNGAYTRTGGVIWIDKSKPEVDARLLEAVKKCLANRFDQSTTL
jgi:hypothetical protein